MYVLLFCYLLEVHGAAQKQTCDKLFQVSPADLSSEILYWILLFSLDHFSYDLSTS